jgi:hypothetical protein
LFFKGSNHLFIKLKERLSDSVTTSEMPKPEMELKLKFFQQASEKFTASLPDFHRPDLFQGLKTFLYF